MTFSSFGDKFTRYSGITQLMDDLDQGLRTSDAIMLGGGNPAEIPQMRNYFEMLCEDLLQDGQLMDTFCNYDGPQGKKYFISSLVQLLNNQFGWSLTEKNIVLTNGSQSAFFYLFNLFAGKQSNGRIKKVLFPLAPEYIGYNDSGLMHDQFVSVKPIIQELPDGQFKYHIDFEKLHIGSDIGMLCVSRPTNPTGNVLTDEEIVRLDNLAQKHNIPLLIDNAYGLPFPSIIFSQVTPLWNENIILCLSLSKLGLPGVRCGIVIANEKVINALTNINGIMCLTPGGAGPVMVNEMIHRGDLLRLSEQVIKPFYQQRVNNTIHIIRRYLSSDDCLIHKPEGAIFLWLWFRNLPITSEELYQRLKKRGVLLVPGHYFFTGLSKPWAHAHQCMRMNYVPDMNAIEKGIQILAQEVERAYQIS